MIGTVTATEAAFRAICSERLGPWPCVSPDDAWLALARPANDGGAAQAARGSALKIARWLKEQPEVGLVLHPALPDCPGHALWKRDFKGSSGLFSFELKTRRPARRLVDHLELFGIGYSWGGYESLAMPADPYRTVSAPPASSLVRLHIGLEDPDDLIADLASALKASR